MSSLNPPPAGAGMAAPARSATPREWGAVLALSLGAFALVASEFMPVSLLTPIATDLRGSEGQAGQAIAVSGAFALVTSLLVSPLAGQLDRKWLLLGLTTAMILSGTLAALAPSFPVFMLGRALIGVAIGGFWAMSAATAMRLVPSHQVPRALAILLRRHHRLARRILLAGAGGRSGPVVENRRVATDEGDRRARFVECVRAVEAPAGGVGHGGREPVLHGPVLAVHLPAAVRGSHAARIAFNVVAVAAVDGRCGPGRHGVDRALRAQGNVPHAGAAASADGPGGCVQDPHRQHAAEGGGVVRAVGPAWHVGARGLVVVAGPHPAR
ncbi:hypothetical protein G6F65_012226 [Rhizopus arrhizus]|nr:hypothetical protein G6F65_012226 [Rhizopus arrhizus]